MVLRDDIRWNWQLEAIFQGEEWTWARRSLSRSLLRWFPQPALLSPRQLRSCSYLTTQSMCPKPDCDHLLVWKLTHHLSVLCRPHVLKRGNSENGFHRNGMRTAECVYANPHTHSQAHYIFFHHLLEIFTKYYLQNLTAHLNSLAPLIPNSHILSFKTRWNGISRKVGFFIQHWT